METEKAWPSIFNPPDAIRPGTLGKVVDGVEVRVADAEVKMCRTGRPVKSRCGVRQTVSATGKIPLPASAAMAATSAADAG